jgi:hypothetical protein
VYAITVRTAEYDLPPEMIDDIIARHMSGYGAGGGGGGGCGAVDEGGMWIKTTTNTDNVLDFLRRARGNRVRDLQ